MVKIVMSIKDSTREAFLVCLGEDKSTEIASVGIKGLAWVNW